MPATQHDCALARSSAFVVLLIEGGKRRREEREVDKGGGERERRRAFPAQNPKPSNIKYHKKRTNQCKHTTDPTKQEYLVPINNQVIALKREIINHATLHDNCDRMHTST